MRVKITSVLMLCLLFSPSLLLASQDAPAASVGSTMDLLLDRAISQNLIAGGVVVIGNHDGILSTSARGRLNDSPGAPSLNDRTVFDLASLTKVIATAPAVMKLVDEGLISLSDPLSRWFPEFTRAGHGDITVLNLLTHTSGLDDFSLGANQSIETAVKKAAAENYRSYTGSRFHYADINFMLLGELVRRVSGESLDAFCRDHIYRPLGTRETMFLPPRDLAADIAPTSGYSAGVVQDPNSRHLGGVAGHAGLFSSAYDLSRFARMMLGGGEIDNKRILSQQVVAQMTTPYLCSNGQVRRGLGWDMNSPFSAPKGSFFSSASFGHTGYSGTSIWIDPQQDLFVILLTRRLNYSNVRSFNQLRRDVSTVAAADFKAPDQDLNKPLAMAKIAAKLQEPTLIASVVVPSGVSRAATHRSQQRLRAQLHSGRAQRVVARASSQRLLRFAKAAKSSKACKVVRSSKKKHASRRRRA